MRMLLSIPVLVAMLSAYPASAGERSDARLQDAETSALVRLTALIKKPDNASASRKDVVKVSCNGDSNKKICRIGISSWCCDSSQSCDLDNFGCK